MGKKKNKKKKIKIKETKGQLGKKKESARDLVTQDEFYISMRKQWRDKENVRRI